MEKHIKISRKKNKCSKGNKKKMNVQGKQKRKKKSINWKTYTF